MSGRWRAALAVGLATGLAACGAGENPRPASWQAVHDTVGDTIVVRTVAGSVWGAPAELVEELRIGIFEGEEPYMFGEVASLAAGPDGSVYVYDRQAKVLRKYTPEGVYAGNLGREGGGPGEYRQPDSGLGVLPDGRVLLRDPGNARINLYSAAGEALGSWPIPGGFFTSDPLYIDTAGTVAVRVLLDPDRSFEEIRTGLSRLRADGTVLDTITAPVYAYVAPLLRVESGDGRPIALGLVPFMPAVHWTLSPLGYAVGGVSTRYAVELFRPGEPVLRIERVVEPVRVEPGERSDEERRRTASYRQMNPSWRWNGPAIPGVKPPFRALLADAEGRIWVQLHQPGREIEGAEEPPHPDRIPPARWTEPVAFDVFEPDGRYLGQVHAPDGFSTHPRPVIRGDQVWAVVRDAEEVQYVVRFRIVRGG